MEHNQVQKIPFGAFSKAKYLVSVELLKIMQITTLNGILNERWCIFQGKLNMKDNQLSSLPLGKLVISYHYRHRHHYHQQPLLS